jgi:hypothetical protein
VVRVYCRETWREVWSLKSPSTDRRIEDFFFDLAIRRSCRVSGEEERCIMKELNRCSATHRRVLSLQLRVSLSSPWELFLSFIVFLSVYNVCCVPFATCSEAVLAFHCARVVFGCCEAMLFCLAFCFLVRSGTSSQIKFSI